MGLSCRCQKLPKGSPGRPCEKCKAKRKARAAKEKASGGTAEGPFRRMQRDGWEALMKGVVVRGKHVGVLEKHDLSSSGAVWSVRAG